MIKILLTVRNRLAITKKCIHALKKHSTVPHQIYVYDNNSNYLLEEHFRYFYKLYREKMISQICFTTEESTFNAFSKASTNNFFGRQHLEDPKRSNYDFLLMLDNDIIVTPEWDQKLLLAWKYVRKHNMENVKVIGQLPGGIKGVGPEIKIGEMVARVGHLGGSGLWSVRPNFFEDVGFLDLSRLVNVHKKHDQNYWILLQKASGGNSYIMGLREKLGIHCGCVSGSVCNRLTRNAHAKNKLDLIKFEEAEEKISGIDFDEFFKNISDDKKLINDW